MNMEHALRKIVPAVSALPNLAECLVLLFLYERRKNRFVLMTDYPDRAAGSDRAFALSIFGGVSDFERERGSVIRDPELSESYQITERTPVLVVQDVQVAEDTGGVAIRFWFGPNFGGVQFKYQDLSVRVRDSRVLEVDDEFAYSDLSSGETFEFTRPFPEHIWLHDDEA